MQYKLLGENKKNNFIETIFLNRGIKREDCSRYLYTTDKDINDYKLLDNIKEGCILLKKHLANKDTILFIVDPDVDGITSSATLWNFIKNHIDKDAKLIYLVHEQKQHGLSDLMELVEKEHPALVIAPDSSSNDYLEHEELSKKNVDILVIDHHDCEEYSKFATVINNQLSKNYPNKMLSGAGVTWQFIRAYNDYFLNGQVDCNYYLDLVALGNVADLMSLTSVETKHIIHKGFYNIRNKMFLDLFSAQSYSMKGNVSPTTVGWYIAPLLNAVCRAGTIDEKRNLFLAFLEENKNLRVPSTKRGHLEGDIELFTTQQTRTAQNIRNRQNKVVEDKMTYIENLINSRKLYEHKLLLILIPEEEIPQQIVGLVANKIAGKYKQPTLILREIDDTYSGSGRNFGNSPIEDFRKELEESGLSIFAEGHASAFGFAIKKDKMDDLIKYFDEKWKDVTFEPCSYVDFEFDYNKEPETVARAISDIADLEKYNLWGKDMAEPLIVIKNLPVSNLNIRLMGKKKDTIRIDENGFNIMIFKSNEDTFEELQKYGKINVIANCNLNVWNGNKTYQIFLKEYEKAPIVKLGWNDF